MGTLGTYDNYAGFYSQLIINQTPPEPAFMREFYRVLYAYYVTNGVYDYLNDQLKATKTTGQTLKPIRNPAWRVVEFYASKLFPGKLPEALPILTENDRIIEPIELIWEWSNFSSVKQRLSRWFAIYGDLFIKIVSRGDPPDAVILTLVRPEHVTDFLLDERGFLTWIRIDVPELNEDGEETSYHTEVWSKQTQTVTIWKHSSGFDKKLDELPSPTLVLTFEQTHGDNFIPIVYQPFRDDGGGRGSGAYAAQLDKIDEANREATRLAQILFRYNRAIWAAVNSGMDGSGRPLPAVSFENLSSDGTITIGDDQVLSLPGSADLKPLVPPINYADALAILESQMDELSRDLPELAYYELRGMRDLSGRAVRFLLDDMISRVTEARGNAETALARANMMAITIGQNLSVFNGVGEYTSGELFHSFVKRPVLPEDMLEIAQTIQTFVAAGGNLSESAQLAGLSEERATALGKVDLFEQAIGSR